MSAPVIVFDLDGTLVDTAPDLARALNAVLIADGYAPVSPDSLGHLYGHGARAMLIKGLADNGVNAPGDMLLDHMQAAFIAHYMDNIAVESRPFPGVDRALTSLSAAGFKLCVCTNKRESLAARLLDTLGLSPHFETLVGGDTYPRAKPHPEPLLRAIERAGGMPQRAVMIGDSRTDIDAARAAGVPVIAVTFGYTAIPVRDLAPDAMISHFDALEDAIRSLPSTPRKPAAAPASRV